MESLKIFTMMIGLPATGKSYVRNVQRLENYHLLSTDAIIESIAEYLQKDYTEVFSQYIDQANRTMNESIDNFIKRGTTPILLDRTNLTKKSRARYIPKFSEAGYGCFALWMDHSLLDEQEHNRRLANRPGKVIPQVVLQDMRDSYEPPSLDEGFDVIQRVNPTNGEVIESIF